MSANSISLLDNLRLSNGAQGLINFYREMLRCDRQKAISLINDPALQFSTLYTLKAELSDREIRNSVDAGYVRALELAERLSEKASQRIEKEMRTAGGDVAPLLEWMFRTGVDEDGLDDKYELLMDRIACLLVKSFNSRAILPELADLIFLRHRRGALIHELVWAFFEARCLDSLAFIAYRFDSSDARDVKLAGKLLGFIPGLSNVAEEGDAIHIRTDGRSDLSSPVSGAGPDSVSGAGSGSVKMTYDRAMYWLSENRPFLYYTGESLHLDGRPEHYRLSLAAKYLCTPVSPDTGEPTEPVRDTGQELLRSRFGGLDESVQRQLADFSWRLYRRNSLQWRSWIALPLENQLSGLSHNKGGST